jgi:hypothetical protein
MLYIYIAIGVIALIAISIYVYKRYKAKREEEKVAAGLQCFDSSGNLILDLTDKLTIILGTRTITGVEGTTGSFTVSIPTNSTLFAYSTCDKTRNPVNMTISGNTISYEIGYLPFSPGSYVFTAHIVYGVF